jgi:hypothetical protein
MKLLLSSQQTLTGINKNGTFTPLSIKFKQDWLKPVSRTAQRGSILLQSHKRVVRLVKEKRVGVFILYIFLILKCVRVIYQYSSYKTILKAFLEI